ncbi:MAG TPA: DUF5719 family protein, partial [Acidimicrobiales bacterium]|nr:DUF5719 family protein [Acidimicrobiales bacterium]
DATELLLLFNPFPDDALLDLVFGTEEGQVTPQALTGLSVRGEGMAVVNVGEFVQRREQVTAAVTARAGRMVVSRLQSFDGSAGRRGMSLSLGSAAVGQQWYLPEGLVTDGLTQRYHVFNPGSQEAAVEVELALEQGDAEPIQLTVPAQSGSRWPPTRRPGSPRACPTPPPCGRSTAWASWSSAPSRRARAHGAAGRH